MFRLFGLSFSKILACLSVACVAVCAFAVRVAEECLALFSPYSMRESPGAFGMVASIGPDGSIAPDLYQRNRHEARVSHRSADRNT